MLYIYIYIYTHLIQVLITSWPPHFSNPPSASVMRIRRSSMVGGNGSRYTCCFTKFQRKTITRCEIGGTWRPREALKIFVGQHVQSISLEIVYSVIFWHLSSNGLVTHPVEKLDLRRPIPVAEETVIVTCICYSWLSPRKKKSHSPFHGLQV